MAFISVQSDGVRAGEDAPLMVSKGRATGPTTSSTDKLEFVFLTIQKNHRELMERTALLKEHIKNLEDQVLQSTLAIMREQEKLTSEYLERVNYQTQVLTAIHVKLETTEMRPLWARIWDLFFGQEKK